MDILSAILYGIIQGLTEFLPVSSSGHLAIIEALGGDNPETLMAFNVLLHVGTLVAVCAAYYKTIIALIPAFFRMIGKLFHGVHKFGEFDSDERFVILVILTTLFLIPTGLIVGNVAALSEYLWAVGIILMINGVLLFVSDKISKGVKGISDATIADSVMIGLAQVLAVLPGLSRSGTTITAGLARGFKREDAVKYSFILSIPATIGAAVLELPDLASVTLSGGELTAYLLGALAAAVVGFAAIKFIQYLSRKSTFRPFGYYCMAIGAAVIIFSIVR